MQNDAHPNPPDMDGAAEALAKASRRDSLDLVVEVVKFRYLQEMAASRRLLIGPSNRITFNKIVVNNYVEHFAC